MKNNKRSQKLIIKYVIPALIVGLFLTLAYAIKNLFFRPIQQKQIYSAPVSTNSTDNTVVNLDLLKQKIKEAEQLAKQGQTNKEILLYKNLLRHERPFSYVHFNLGKAFSKKKDHKSAEAHFKKVIELNPEYTSAYVFLGATLKNLEKYEESAKYLEKAVKMSPNYFDANLHLSKAYYESGKLDLALDYAKKTVALKPKNIYGLLNLAYTYNKRGELDLAIDMYNKVLEVSPRLANAHYNLGYSLKIQGKFEEAIQSLDKAIEIKPKYIDAHLARAQCKIASENIVDGWEEYEWRWGIFDMDPMKYKNSMWDGSNIKGKTILLRTEQGLGDTMQFVRYAQLVKNMGATVICKVQKPLVKLLSYCPYIDKVINKLDSTITFDAQAQLMSLPRILKTTKDTIPNQMNYLFADEKLEKEWKEKLSRDKNFKVGLCWHVDPIHEKDKSPWSIRSVNLKMLTPFAKLNGVSFYSLQKFRDYEPLLDAPAGLNLKTFGDDFDDKHGAFMDSTAIIKNLDLIITVDTCIAHLAGALNKPVWMLLPYSPDCRWYKDRSDTPWYPTMKLYRQPSPGNWKNVIAMLAKDLSEKLEC